VCKLERRSILQLQVWWLEPKAKPGAKTHFVLNVGMYDRIETQPGLGVLLREPKGNNLLVAKLEYTSLILTGCQAVILIALINLLTSPFLPRIMI
jgi:hypothetical protein